MAWWHRAKPGDKVVCVKPPDYSKDPAVEVPRLAVGSVYTIAEIDIDPWFCAGIGFVVALYSEDGREQAFDAVCFRPVQKKSTEAGLAALRKHLNTKEVVVDG